MTETIIMWALIGTSFLGLTYNLNKATDSITRITQLVVGLAYMLGVYYLGVH